MGHPTRPRYTAIGLLALVLAACGAGSATSEPTTPPNDGEKATTTSQQPPTTTPTEGTLEIETSIDFSEVPYSGSFEVIDGDAVLGCVNGSFEDTPVADGVEKVFACENGIGSGTFTVHVVPPEGPWSIVDGSGDFVFLRGEGEFTVAVDDTSEKGVETLTGEVRVITEAEAAAEPTTTTTEAITDFDVVEVDSLAFAYECAGSGSPAVVISHGLAGPGAEAYQDHWGGFRPTIDALAEFTRVCIFGRPGVGGSEPRPDTPQTTSTQERDLVEFVEAVGIDEPIVVLGYSWGGLIAQLMAHDHPERVAGLILLDSSHPGQDERFGDTPPDPFPPEHIDIPASMAEVRGVRDLGDLPLFVVSAGSPPPGVAEDSHEIWLELQDELAALSTDTGQTVVAQTDHQGMPAATQEITDAVRDLMDRIEAADSTS